ncbi:hypothetical protein GLOIN_2v598493 [Rhizophagus irregularis DAOM 181602=DAOM 197198]|nr:hypothetical protein GLOIN_2v598493 [Rhizophagus irregularis DAOM 181602=DAOM 197198]
MLDLLSELISNRVENLRPFLFRRYWKRLLSLKFLLSITLSNLITNLFLMHLIQESVRFLVFRFQLLDSGLDQDSRVHFYLQPTSQNHNEKRDIHQY